jgi:hypothetical protein
MGFYVDVDYASLNKHNEELCGDKVEIIRNEDSVIIVLADGLSSGVKANILATLTSKIIGTMMSMGASIEEAVETVINTLPISKDKDKAYSKLTILQIFNTGEALLTEFENPKAIRLIKGKSAGFNKEFRMINGRRIKESRFTMTTDEIIVLVSDGAIHAGEGMTRAGSWNWEDVQQYVERIYKRDISSKNVAKLMITACNNLYSKKPEHDTTVICAKIKQELRLNVLIGPPINKALDNYVVGRFIDAPGKKIICGSTISAIVKRETGRRWKAKFNYLDALKPPEIDMEGIDLLTEGRLTVSKTLAFIRGYANSESTMPDTGLTDTSARLTRMLVDESTEVVFYLGRTNNEAQSLIYEEELTSKVEMIEEMERLLSSLGKKVSIEYF